MNEDNSGREAMQAAAAIVKAAAQAVSQNYFGAVITVIKNLKPILKLAVAVVVFFLFLIFYLLLAPLSIFLQTNELAYMNKGFYINAYELVRTRTVNIMTDNYQLILDDAYRAGNEAKAAYGEAGSEINVVVLPSDTSSLYLTRDAAAGMMAKYHVYQYYLTETDYNNPEEYGNAYYELVKKYTKHGSSNSMFVTTVDTDVYSYEVVTEADSSEEESEEPDTEDSRDKNTGRWRPKSDAEPRTETQIRYAGTITVQVKLDTDRFMMSEMNSLLRTIGGVPMSGRFEGYVYADGQFAWPLAKAPADCIITTPSSFFDVFHGGAHRQIDIAAESGTPVLATSEGTVTMAGDYGNGYGNYVVISHEDGYTSHYGHMSSVAVSVGQEVVQGQEVGAVGSTGHSTGPHLDFDISFNGEPLNPIVAMNMQLLWNGQVQDISSIEDYYDGSMTLVAQFLSGSDEQNVQKGKSVDFRYPYGTVAGFGSVRQQDYNYWSDQIKGAAFDSKGFYKVNNRYVVSVAADVGAKGDELTVTLKNGEQIFMAVGGNIINNLLTTDYGYREDDGTYVMAQFWVDSNRWYTQQDHRYIRTHEKVTGKGCHPEWDSYIYSIENETTGDVFTNAVKLSNDYLSVMELIASDDSHGYCREDGKNMGPDFDCGSFISYALYKAGIFSKLLAYEPNTETSTEPDGSPLDIALKDAGFLRIPYESQDELLAGDILLAPGHAETYYGHGKLIGAHNETQGISIKNFYEGDWKYIYRLESAMNRSAGSRKVTEEVRAEIDDVKEYIQLEFMKSHKAATQKEVKSSFAKNKDLTYEDVLAASVSEYGMSSEDFDLCLGWAITECFDEDYLSYLQACCAVNRYAQGLRGTQLVASLGSKHTETYLKNFMKTEKNKDSERYRTGLTALFIALERLDADAWTISNHTHENDYGEDRNYAHVVSFVYDSAEAIYLSDINGYGCWKKDAGMYRYGKKIN